MKDQVGIYFLEAERIRVVDIRKANDDNLNAHSPAAFYEAFSPQQARYLNKKLEFHYTPEHSSWLNVVEFEISVLTEQCLDRRLASQQSSPVKLVRGNLNGTLPGLPSIGVSRSRMPCVQFTRNKLKKLYPVGEE